MASKKYYVVEIGLVPGIYENWEECKKNVNGYKNAKYKSYVSLDEAKKAFYSSIIFDKKIENNIEIKEKNNNIKYNDILKNSICVDGACSGNPGKGEYQCVDTLSKEVIFKSKIYEDSTNNLMEFLALVNALIYLKENNKDCYIYTDSVSALAWVRDKEVKTSLKETKKNIILFDEIKERIFWLKSNQVNMNKILKWDTKVLGEIPADFGRK